MRVHALLSWYAEKPLHLYELVTSVAPFVDSIVAVDGPYPLYPHYSPSSDPAEYQALRDSATDGSIKCHIFTPGPLPEVDKRAFMFEAALACATPWEDWFLIIDADMMLSPSDPLKARVQLALTDRHVGEVTLGELAYGSDDTTISSVPFRGLYRAIPGITVTGSHAMYTAPVDGKREFLWQGIPGKPLPLPAVDLTEELQLWHRPHTRDRDRQTARAAYYAAREPAGIERTPNFDDPDD